MFPNTSQMFSVMTKLNDISVPGNEIHYTFFNNCNCKYYNFSNSTNVQNIYEIKKMYDCSKIIIEERNKNINHRIINIKANNHIDFRPSTPGHNILNYKRKCEEFEKFFRAGKIYNLTITVCPAFRNNETIYCPLFKNKKIYSNLNDIIELDFREKHEKIFGIEYEWKEQ